jgi:putative Mg2+ transporter-C (MgtC) family protein
MLVALGSATLVVATITVGGSTDAVTRVVQGATAGIGFIGAGAILKLSDEERVHGLTTAASIWMTAALGLAAGMGRLWLAVAAGLLAWLVLGLMRFERHARGAGKP